MEAVPAGVDGRYILINLRVWHVTTIPVWNGENPWITPSWSTGLIVCMNYDCHLKKTNSQIIWNRSNVAILKLSSNRVEYEIAIENKCVVVLQSVPGRFDSADNWQVILKMNTQIVYLISTHNGTYHCTKKNKHSKFLQLQQELRHNSLNKCAFKNIQMAHAL